MSLSLYIHIPFCGHRCAYCDFNTYTSLGELKGAYAAAVCAELAQVAGGEKRPYHTIFFGGGTPSLMPPETIRQILQAVNAHFSPVGVPEITMEANPGTVDGAYLTAVAAAGVNRLSFGVQSAVASELALLERTHDFATAVQAVAMARAAGLSNFNLDLIYGLPGQTLASWRESLDAVLALEPPHLSLYCLTIEPGTPMQRWLLNGRIQPPDPDLAADQYDLACDLLAQHGYDHYEISNWAKPGGECAHNLTYWRDGEYLGLGAGAHGHAGGVRYQVVKQPRVYIRRLEMSEARGYPLSTAVSDYHAISQDEAMTDAVITQLRLLQEGLDLAAFAARFGRTLDEAFPGTAAQLAAWDMVREANGRLYLTPKAYFLSNQVFYRFILSD
ncbi:MAG: radical SAM family heme chaperone HemW [Chloroflexi bacterium]|nr:radical SAM family heme chaperone HemW [Chloroflexota bacterium]MBP7043454.1 radical SAM family heme chaperone HemW [Chloroflexota bacterium]